MEIWEMILQSMSTVMSWPVVVLVLALVYKKPMTKAVSRLTRYRGFGQELDFGQTLAELESEESTDLARITRDSEPTEALPGESAAEPDADREDELKPERLAETEPSFVVLSSWEGLQRSIADLAQQLEPVTSRHRLSSNAAERILVKNRVIGPRLVRELRALRDLRNSVAHGQHRPSPGEALTYASLTSEINSEIQSMARHPSRLSVHRSQSNDDGFEPT